MTAAKTFVVVALFVLVAVALSELIGIPFDELREVLR